MLYIYIYIYYFPVYLKLFITKVKRSEGEINIDILKQSLREFTLMIITEGSTKGLISEMELRN